MNARLICRSLVISSTLLLLSPSPPPPSPGNSLYSISQIYCSIPLTPPSLCYPLSFPLCLPFLVSHTPPPLSSPFFFSVTPFHVLLLCCFFFLYHIVLWVLSSVAAQVQSTSTVKSTFTTSISTEPWAKAPLERLAST